MDDDDDEVEEGRSPTPGTSKARPDGRKKSKAAERNRAEAKALQEKIEDLMWSRKEMAEKALEMKKELYEKKQQEKLARWLEVKENEEKKLAEEKRKADFEERRLLLEENRMRQEMLAEENRIMMMDPSSMDVTARAYWDIRRREILQSRMTWSGMVRGGGATPTMGGGGATPSMGGGGATPSNGDDGGI